MFEWALGQRPIQTFAYIMRVREEDKNNWKSFNVKKVSVGGHMFYHVWHCVRANVPDGESGVGMSKR